MSGCSCKELCHPGHPTAGSTVHDAREVALPPTCFGRRVGSARGPWMPRLPRLRRWPWASRHAFCRALRKGKLPSDGIRQWSAGCQTGTNAKTTPDD